MIAVLPRRFTPGEGEDDRARLRAAAARLRAAVARLRAEERAALVFVQFGGGRFGTDGADCALPEACAAVGFAASVHLERPAARVRVVDVSPRASADAVAAAALCELGGQAPFAAAGHDLDGARRVRRARVSSPAAAPRRALRLGPDDVVLVTGGARGITAECALALGRATSARFALLGSSALDADPDGEIRRTLERFAAAGLRASYLRCDMTRYDDVAAAIARASEELGPITAVVHGAGLNRPRRAEQVRLDDAVAEAAPKLLGGLHLCRALEGSPPRLFIAMTSVIGVTGVPGNAWYAWANASLDLLLRRFGERHGVQVAGAAFSVWDEVGMGARLGSIEALGRLGIGAIPIEEGVRRFLALVERDPGDAQAIITARLGSPVLDTWPAEAPPPPSGRFTTRALRFTPGVEWVGRATLSHDADRYVADHLYRGSYLFPTVFGLEAMTQAAAAALGGGPCDVARIEDVRLSRPIVVSAGATEEIEIHAEVLDRENDGACAVRAGIRTAASGFSVDHFAATLILGEPEAGPQGEEGDAAEAAHDLQPGRDLYGPVLFQGPLFQRIAAVDALGGGRVTLRAEARESSLSGDEGFGLGAQGRGALRLGDPYLRDAMLQSVQLIIPRTSCLPIAIARIERYAGGDLAGPRQVRAVLLRREGDEFVTDVEARDGWGRVVERLRGYRLRILHEVPGAPSAEELARPGERDERLLRDAAARAGLRAPALGLVHAPGLHALPRKDRHEAERPLIARAWAAWRGDAAPACAWDDDGRPRFCGPAAGEEAGPGLSISHDESYCLCAVGPGPQGCDLAPVTARTDEEWRALLGDQRAGVRAALQRRGDPLDRAATRVWAAAEAARKALGAAHIDLSVAEGGQGEAVVLTASAPAEGRSCQVLTAPVTLARGPERVIALVLHPEPAAEPASASPSPSPSPSGETVYVDEETGRREQRRRFTVTFEEANTVGRRVGAARYGRLIGRVRELAFAPFAGQVLPEIAAGQLGLVTNSTTLTVLGDLTALDVVEARLHLRELRDPAATIGFEFYKVRPDGGAEPVAVAWQGFTWVRVLGHGAVAPEPMPPALRDFLTSMQLDAAALRGLTPRRPEVSGPAHLGPVLRRDLARTLTEEVLPTTLEHGNLVGNIYWANYLGWAAALLDHFVQSVNPAYVRPGGAAGELLCTSIAVDHAREAMPFDRIRVSLVVRAVSERGATLDVHFFREGHAAPAGSATERARLAAGRIEVAWTDRRGGVRSPAPWPDDLRGALLVLDDDEEEAARAG